MPGIPGTRWRAPRCTPDAALGCGTWGSRGTPSSRATTSTCCRRLSRARRPGLHRPAVQHRQRLRLHDDIRGGTGMTRHQAWVAMMRPRLEAARELLPRPRRDLRQHRRQRGGPPAAAAWTRSSARRTSSPRSWSTSTRRAASWAAASRRATSTSSSTPGTRAALRARREQHRDRRRARLPADRERRPALPAPAAAQHQQEVQPDHRAHPALHGLGRPRDRAGAHARRSTARRRSGRSSATAGRRSGGGAGR